MSSKRRWLWAVLFVWAVVTMAILATGWNLVLVRDYKEIMAMAHSLGGAPAGVGTAPPWATIALGTLGFAAVMGMMLLLFLRLLSEMRLNQLQSEFLATVSHELKTPLASLELASSLLRAGDLSEAETNHLWQSHANELKRLREEVESVLEAARWKSSPIRVQGTAVKLEEWLDASMLRWQRILGPTATLRREGDPLPPSAWLDPKTFTLITDNIIDNARKFARGAPELVIQTRRLETRRSLWNRLTGRLPRSWSIAFVDHGWGFPPEQARKIFHPFYRARSQAPYAIPGTGLGLYLVASACRAQGLRIRARSGGVGTGAAFVVEGREVRQNA